MKLASPSLQMQLSLMLSLLIAFSGCFYQASLALGIVTAQPIGIGNRLISIKKKKIGTKNFTEVHYRARRMIGDKAFKGRLRKQKKGRNVVLLPQNYISVLKMTNIAPGVVYKSFKGPLTINVLDIDMAKSLVKVHPILPNASFSSLEEIGEQAKNNHALAAVNANYFKKNGIPLGTLIIDGEWVSGPIYDRVALGFTKSGSILVDRVKLAGRLETSNSEIPSIWINNINQPRRNGSRLVAYTRRWGSFVRLDYEGCLVALDAQGRVTDKSTQFLNIPYGGYVLTDSKDGEVSKLQVGDLAKLSWQASPNSWDEVEQAVSGGPLLIKNGNIFLDLQDEKFRPNWTGRQIQARTAAGVTADRHLLLVTVEGPHTLWDLAKFLHKLGATDALNLDGGGSTAMFVGGTTVTRSKRKVVGSIGLFTAETLAKLSNNSISSYAPRSNDLSDFIQSDTNTLKTEAEL